LPDFDAVSPPLIEDAHHSVDACRKLIERLHVVLLQQFVNVLLLRL
jgi:hypothetical protein